MATSKPIAYPWTPELQERLQRHIDEMNVKSGFGSTGFFSTTAPSLPPFSVDTLLKLKEKLLSELPDDEWFLVRVPRGHQIYSVKPMAYTMPLTFEPASTPPAPASGEPGGE